MSDNRIQDCIIINNNNIDIIGKALEEYWSHEYHHGHTIIEINDVRIRVKKIKDQLEKSMK